MKQDIILSGVGGQGILSIATIIGEAATQAGLTLKQAEVHGMSQRGGDVQSNLRLSDGEIASDLIAAGTADMILSLEPMEALRYIPYLNKDGWVITSSSPFKNIPNYPEDEALMAELRALPHVVMVDVDALAKEHSMPKCANVMLLGAAARYLNILSVEELRESIARVFGTKGEAVVDQGSPGLPANRVGVEAEKAALDRGVGAQYPAADGIPELKREASRFVKAFVDIDISPQACIPTTGSVAASFGAFVITTQCVSGKDKVLFIDPGFPIQKSQLRIIGAKWEQFDIYHYRGEALREKLESYLKQGDIAAIVYSNPNNPAWICLEDSELAIIGELSTRYGVIVLEDMAYFCMDFRQDLGQPWKAPYPPTVARYTDNYILMLSSSKIFSYAGQRMAVACVSDKLFDTHYPALAERYGDSGVFGQTFVASVLYMITSGCTASTQYGYAEMLRAATDGELDFAADGLNG